MNIEVAKSELDELTYFDRKARTAIRNNLLVKNNSAKIKCVITEKDRKLTPEELVRQLMIIKLMKEYNYPKELFKLEVGIVMGSTVHNKKADIVIINKTSLEPYIIIEVKKRTRTDGIKQLKSYCNATGSPISVWSNGVDVEYLARRDPNEFVFISDVPKHGQTLKDMSNEDWDIDRLTKENRLKKGLRFKELIQDLENIVLANSGVDSFEEIFKLIYAKLFDEYSALHDTERNGKIHFRRYLKNNDQLFDDITKLFESAKEKWNGVFENDDHIKLTPSHLVTCVTAFENIRLFNSNLYVIDEAFEYLVSKVAKGEKGQYFTPRHVIDMCVKMINPKKNEFVIDTAAGSCGFTIHTLFHVFNTNSVFSATRPPQDQIDYASTMIYGIDFDERSVKIAKALNLIAGDGKTNVYNANTLDPSSWKEEVRVGLKIKLKKIKNHQENASNKKNNNYFDFDVVLTNPPFAGDIEDRVILNNYKLGKKNGKPIKVSRHILFIERNLNFLKDGGRMAIVLPEGFFSNTKMKYLREFVHKRCKVLAVVSLSSNTFKPHTGTKTSILFVQKWDDKICKKTDDYDIFMASSEKSGKDNKGDPIFKKDSKGNRLIDEHGHPEIDHDLFEISDKFEKFKKKHGLRFN